jgi:hypothetical protein
VFPRAGLSWAGLSRGKTSRALQSAPCNVECSSQHITPKAERSIHQPGEVDHVCSLGLGSLGLGSLEA